jgi:aryl-alcohol dehydrogenase-like predicted oxidoreductase
MLKLGLGTAQFGLDYGVANRRGQTPVDEVRGILVEAARRGVGLIDTASLYGTSEEALGKALPTGHSFRIVTKTGKFDRGFGAAEARALEGSFRASLRKLDVPSTYGLLVHQADDLLTADGERLMDCLQSIKAANLVSKVGVSVYTGEQAMAVLARHAVDIVQLPLSLLDQRSILRGELRALKAAGVEIHARSVFLQGLLLMDPETLPPYFDPVRPTLASFRAAAAARGLTALQAALAFVQSRPEVDHFVVGVCDLPQFLEILEAVGKPPAPLPEFAPFHCPDERFVNPSLWPSEARARAPQGERRC